jgi:hypothetical protein
VDGGAARPGGISAWRRAPIRREALEEDARHALGVVFDHLVCELVEQPRAEPHGPLALRHRDEQRDDLERIVVEGDVALRAAVQDIVDKSLALFGDGLAEEAQGSLGGLARPHRPCQRGDRQHETKRIFRDDRQHIRGRWILFRCGDHLAHHPLEP